MSEEGAFDEGADAGAFVGVELVEGGEVQTQGLVLGSAFVLVEDEVAIPWNRGDLILSDGISRWAVDRSARSRGQGWACHADVGRARWVCVCSLAWRC